MNQIVHKLFGFWLDKKTHSYFFFFIIYKQAFFIIIYKQAEREF